jgi:hypothetical protein
MALLSPVLDWKGSEADRARALAVVDDGEAGDEVGGAEDEVDDDEADAYAAR